MSVIYTITPGTTLINNQYHSFWNQEEDAIATTSLEQTAQDALASGVAANAKADTLLATALQVSGSNYTGLPDAGILLKDNTDTTTFLVDGNSGDLGAKGYITGFGFANTNSSFQVNDIGNCTVNELTYTSLNPPITPGATPSLSQVLAVSGDGGNQQISNVENLFVNNVINTPARIETNQVSILNDGGTGYHVMDSNTSGVDLNTKFTSDGLILHKVAAGSDITIQNDATNLVTLGTASGYADLQVGTLNYIALNPPIGPGVTPTLAEVLAAGNDGGTYAIVGISQITANDSLQILKDADQPELGTYTLNTNPTTGFNVGGGASLTANTLIGGSTDGIAFQNADASFRANFDGSVNTTSVSFPNSTSIVAGGNGEISFDGANVVDITELTVGTLNCSTFNPPISTPTLAQVLAVGADGNQVDITNCGNITASGFTTAGNTETNTLYIKDNTQTLVAQIDNQGFISAAQLSIGSVAQIDTTGNITCELVNGVAPEFKPTYTYFVSKGGNDTEGLGSILSPYLTIQKAISVCEAFTDGNPRVVNVLAGSYVENLTLTKSRISIIGQGQSSRPDVGTSISGTITVTIASGNSDLNNNNIYFSNFLINGLFEDNTASISYPHRVFFDRCQLYANNRVLYLHPAGDYRAFVSNCVISNDNTSATDPVIECYSSSTGMVSFTSNQITSKGASQNVFKLSGSCRIDTYAQNILTSDSVGTNVAIAIFVHNSTAVISLGQNAFVYSSAGAKRNTDTAAGIYMSAASGGTLVIASNFFSLTGLPTGQNAVQNNSAAGVVIYGNNISTSSAAGTSAHDISGSNNVTKFAMTSVQ